MPNWCTNTVTFICDDEEKIKKLTEHIKGDERHPIIDFNKIIPMPESLKVESGSRGELAMRIIYGMKEYYCGSLLTDEECQKRWDNQDQKDKDESIKIAAIYKDNLEKYGHKDWYDWSNEKWGTKWNASEAEIISSNCIMFDTPWGPPDPVLYQLACLFPGVEILNEWREESGLRANNTYYIEIKNEVSNVQ